MSRYLPTKSLIEDIEQSEIDYMVDRMRSIQLRDGNPEGVEILHMGHATCFYSKSMPWPMFNTVKGLSNEDLEHLESMLAFYRERGRKPRLELIPSQVDASFMAKLSQEGFYQSGFHTSLYMEPRVDPSDEQSSIVIRELHGDEFDVYATIHCLATGLEMEGVPYVAMNNRILHDRAGWKFYLATVEDVPAAVGVMYVQNDIASLTFGATLPEYRNRGLQYRLIIHRIQEAYRKQCRLVVSQCAFLSSSHRNMERAGMRIGYVRATWERES
ncbi:GNAT family N-acetyltransferase [Paenibacillus guangzhouensis]|uniref:GNAT family N-acetyltransferase n=1 Tax=Paenibacillus guangzhouensis TaxID=1473112 RepID=UPI001266C363|nr:GNAT family N-acetyltransferase [Paenibacillus guangzhouensis]